MLDPTSLKWSEAKPAANQAFFALLWEQLCGGSTLDSWQLRARNLSALLWEVIDICATARSFAPLQRALVDVFAEAVNISHRDPLLKNHFRAATAVLEDPRLTDQTPAGLAYAEQTALHLLDTLSTYPSLMRAELERLCGDESAREKQRISSVANSLATELHMRGFSRVFLHAFAEPLVYSPFKDALQRLLSLLERPKQRFRCIIPMTWPSFLGGLKLEGGTVHATEPDLGSSVEATTFRKTLRKNDLFFVTEVEARDEFAAAHKAMLTAARVLNLAVFYAPNRNLEIARRQMFVQAGATAFLVELDVSHESYIRDSHRSNDKLLKTPPRVNELLAGPLQYHALGVQATAPESRLTNFWVALESLLVEHDGSIIEKITKFIPPSLALSYSSRLLVANAIELSRFIRAMTHNKMPETADLRTATGVGDKERVFFQSVPFAQMLMDEGRMRQLFALCARNPLLIFRLNQMRERIIRATELKQSIDGHRQRVGWQLGRIYRARNSLVHRGSLPPRTEHLIQHLHTYLSMTLHYLVREIGDSSILTVTAAFSRRRALYDLYMSKIHDGTLTFTNLAAESSCWQTSADTSIWPAKLDATDTKASAAKS